MHHWGKYFRAIVDFADGTKHMSKELKHTQCEDDLPAKGKLTAKNVTCARVQLLCLYDSLKAVRCLAHFLTPKNKKAVESSNLDAPYLIAEALVSLSSMAITHCKKF